MFNTFQALLRSTPGRLAEYLDESQRLGFSIGVKLVRGAYLVSEMARWREARAAGRPGVPDQPPVWASKAETDACFDSLASGLVQQLASNARKAEGAVSHPRQSRPITEVAMMIAGHNSLSAAKVLKQLRDEEGLAQNIDGQSIHLSDSLRGRLMFAQLYGNFHFSPFSYYYFLCITHSSLELRLVVGIFKFSAAGMADDLTTALAQVLGASEAGRRQPQPFVFKYLPFGPVDKVLPYLARRAEENSSILAVRSSFSPPTTFQLKKKTSDLPCLFSPAF